MITETIFENRFMHVPELARMGADIEIDGHTAIVHGVKPLQGATVMATDLRARRAWSSPGWSPKARPTIERVYHLDRGYEAMEEKLAALGARVQRVK